MASAPVPTERSVTVNGTPADGAEGFESHPAATAQITSNTALTRICRFFSGRGSILIPEATCVDVSGAGLGGAGKARQGSLVGPND